MDKKKEVLKPVKKPIKKEKPIFVKTKELLKKDLPTSKGIKKAGTYVEVTKEGKQYLKKQFYI